MRTTYRIFTAVIAAAAVATGCGAGAGAETSARDPDATTTTAAPQAELSDGTHEGFLRSIDGDDAVIDVVELLSGDEAVRAAVDAGDLRPGDDLPNDYYLANPDPATRTVALADDVRVELYDCTEGCTRATVDAADFVAGRIRAYFGDEPLMEVEVRDGAVVRLSEVYLP